MAREKVGIVTMFDRYNFGNRLQNYGVQTALEKLGFDCETIVSEGLYKTSKNNVLRQALIDSACWVGADKLSRSHPAAVRDYRVKQFNKNIHFRVVSCENNLFPSSLAKEYSFFVTGSDQVWNPHFWPTSIGSEEAGFNNYFLRFAEPTQRKCFSPSIGLNEIPVEWQERFCVGWKEMSSLCVREQKGADLIYALTGKQIEVTLDPTLLLSADDWRKVERPTKNRPEGKYILYLMLGSEANEIPDERKKMIAALAKQKGLSSCRMMIRKRPEWFACGPGEFIHLIRNAELVCTDSFHCTVFSILFGKPFLLFSRIIPKYGIDMSSRTNTLLSLLHLERKMTSNQQWTEADIFECDYTDSMQALENERKRTLAYFEKTLLEKR